MTVSYIASRYLPPLKQQSSQSTSAAIPERFFVPASKAEVEIEVKKSRFIGQAWPAADRAEAMDALDLARQQYPDARHHCWAYLIGSPKSPKTVAMSDDGEPGGTAGKPILNVLQHKNVGNIMLVVVRYFGGIKLGAGGLVRAYSQSAQTAMDALSLTEFVASVELEVRCNFAAEHSVRHWLSVHSGQIDEVRYEAEVVIRCSLAVSELPEWRQFRDTHQLSSKAL